MLQIKLAFMNPRDKRRRKYFGRLRPRKVSEASDDQENETAEKIFVIGVIILVLVIAYYLSR